MTSKCRLKGALVIAAVCPVLPASAQLTTVVDNLAQSDPLGQAESPYDNGWFAQGFTMPSGSSYNLTDVTLKVSHDSQSFSGTFTVSIWDATGAGGTPGSNLGSVGTATVGSIPTVDSIFSNYTLTPSTSIALAPSTSYFVVVQASASAAAAGLYWAETDATNPSTGIGVMGNWTAYHGAWDTFQTTDTDLQMGVTATPVPEPALCAVFSGIGLLGLVTLRRWQRCR